MWQYITLMKRIYLIDCPGVVPPSNGDSEQDILLRGVVRVENVENPAQYIPAVLRRAQTRHVERTYEIKHADYDGDAIEFLSILARKGGRLLRGGEADVDGVAKMVLNDFLRGKIPWFSAPPKKDGIAAEVDDQKVLVDGREGRLGEMPSKGHKRKRDEVDAADVGSDAQNTGENNGVEHADDDAVHGQAVGDSDDDGDDDGDDDVLENGLDINDDNDVDDSGDEEDRTGLDEGDQDSAIEHPFEAFSSDDEEGDSGGVPAS